MKEIVPVLTGGSMINLFYNDAPLARAHDVGGVSGLARKAKALLREQPQALYFGFRNGSTASFARIVPNHSPSLRDIEREIYECLPRGSDNGAEDVDLIFEIGY